MSHRTTSKRSIAACILAAFIAFTIPVTALAQLPGGGSLPRGGSLPTGGLSKDSLLSQAKQLLSELTSMKNSGKLAPDQMKQVDGLMPKAQSLTSELEKPQVEASKLPQLASNLSELQKEVGALKSLIK